MYRHQSDRSRRPYPGDGSNGPNALTIGGIVRSDIRSSAGVSGTADGVPLNIVLTIVSASTCAPLVGRAVSQVSLAIDNVFSDGASLKLATVTGSVSSGLTATLTVAL